MKRLDRCQELSSEQQFDLIGLNTNKNALWNIEFVDEIGSIDVNNVDRTMEYKLDKAFNIQTLTMTWASIPVGRNSTSTGNGSIVDIIMSVTLVDGASTSLWNIGVDVVNGTAVGLWQATVSIPLSVGNTEDGELFFPSGFGTSFSNPIRTAGGGVSALYPASGATMQFMALGRRTATSAAYVAALDPSGHPKQFQYSTNAITTGSTYVKEVKPNEVSTSGSYRVGEVQSYPLSSSVPTPSLAYLSITIYPPDAGVAIHPGDSWRSAYMLSVGIISSVSAAEGRPLYHEAALKYRDWVLADASWTKQGPFSRQPSVLPDWYRSNSIWLNTHWQCHDVFNETGGDPSFVGDNTRRVAEVLGQETVALHWYEWQQGPDPAPEAR